MWNIAPADIIGEILSYFDCIDPKLFAISRHWRVVAIAHFSQRPICASYVEQPGITRLVLNWLKPADLKELVIRDVGYGSFMNWGIDGTKLHPRSLVMLFGDFTAREIMELYDVARVCESWRMMELIEIYYLEHVPALAVSMNVPARSRRQMWCILRDDVYSVARMRKTGSRLLLYDRKIFAIAREFGCWRVARHLLSTPNGISMRDIGELRVAWDTPNEQPTLKLNRWISKILSRRIKMLGDGSWPYK